MPVESFGVMCGRGRCRLALMSWIGVAFSTPSTGVSAGCSKLRLGVRDDETMCSQLRHVMRIGDLGHRIVCYCTRFGPRHRNNPSRGTHMLPGRRGNHATPPPRAQRRARAPAVHPVLAAFKHPPPRNPGSPNNNVVAFGHGLWFTVVA
jgi:hypothetical protein